MNSPCEFGIGSSSNIGFAKATSESLETHAPIGVSLGTIARSALPKTCGYHATGAVVDLKLSGLFDAASHTVTPHRGGRIASIKRRCQVVCAEPLSMILGANGSVLPDAASELSDNGSSGWSVDPNA